MHIYEVLHRVESFSCCFRQAHCILHQSMFLVCLCFTVSKPCITRANAVAKPLFSVTFLQLSVLVDLQVNMTDNFQKCVSAYTIHIQGTEHFLQKPYEEKFDTTAELNRGAGGANQGKANKGGKELCTSLEVKEEWKLQLRGGKQ